jgi:putative hydrolases of HD superfamily
MKQPQDIQKDINFLFEIGNIRHINRMWVRFLNTSTFANVAEHHFRVFWIAMTIAAHEKNVDTGKIAKMVLVHDIAESRTGEVDYISRQYADRKEELAMQDMLEGTAVQDEYYALWEEYEKRECLEAKIVKDADNLDVDFELLEQSALGSTLPKEWKEMRQSVADRKMYTETAKRMFEQLKNANPHAWHLNTRNRRNGGDWRK